MTRRRTTVRAAAEVALGRQRAPQHESGPHMVPYLRAANVKDGRLDLSDVKQMNFSPGEQQVFSLQAGDVLVTEGSGSLGAVGASAVWRGEIAGTVCFQNTLLRMRPRTGIADGRFLEWWARHAFGNGLFASVATGANIYHISAERVRALPMDLPPLEEQRRIADFLDAETARIDSLVAKRAQMRRLVALKRDQVIEQSLGFGPVARPRELVPMKYIVATVSVGIVITPAKWYVETDGIPALRGLNVKPGAIDTSDLARISTEGHAENSKSRLRAGDVVVVRTGQAGAAAVVPPELDGANCIDLIIVRPGRKVIPKYLEYVLNSDYARSRVSEHAVGSIQAHFNVGSMKQIPIPSIPVLEQREVVHQIDQRVESLDQLFRVLARQEELLAERRQALTTAAVTGQLDVWTASERAVDV